MSKVFQVRPKRVKRANGTVLTPEMVVTVTTQQHTVTPFYNGAKEVQEAYMRLYAFDYKKRARLFFIPLVIDRLATGNLEANITKND